MHWLFETAYSIRCNPDSIDRELFEADNMLNEALILSAAMEKITDDLIIIEEIITDRLRCYIEQLAIYTRLLKNAYGTPSFDAISLKQEEYCKLYMYNHSETENNEIQQSQYQLIIMAYQSLAANYFRRGGMGKDKSLCQQAVMYLEEAMELTKGDKVYDILKANKHRILLAVNI